MDSGEIVVSSIRIGMKREFAMMMKRNQIGGLPAGGRRMTRSQSTAGSSKGYVRSADKGGGGQNLNFVELFRELEYYVLVMNARKKEYIFLNNGKSLRDVLNACKANLSESLESVILNAIGRSNYTIASCINCKELIREAGAGRSMLLCDSCVQPKESDPSDAQISHTSRS
ncbi:hypothetical protein Sango_2486800 [Sesamum angolense]|uniref:Uncharacterized protein n=1 Tax=Sesamum angolense TaxID=2727404 RepID=A0AAE2BI17_9LAMI|nr:hypothetical protein Sango_2486800 [Sesamum angolense]